MKPSPGLREGSQASRPRLQALLAPVELSSLSSGGQCITNASLLEVPWRGASPLPGFWKVLLPGVPQGRRALAAAQGSGTQDEVIWVARMCKGVATLLSSLEKAFATFQRS